MKNLLDLTVFEKKEFINSFDLILCDCDGVIWLIFGTIPQTGIAINLLKHKAGKEFKFISNNSLRNDQEFIQNLNDIGIMDIKQDDIVYPIKTIANYLKTMKIIKPIYTLTNSDLLNKNLKEFNINVLPNDNDTKKLFNNLNEFTNDIKVNEKCGAVIFDIDLNLTLAKLTKAKLYLDDPDCLLIVGSSDLLIPIQTDVTVLGPGSFIQILTMATGKEPIVLGKPGQLLADYLIKFFNIIEPKRTLFIGDAIIQDINFANNCGFQTLLVLSGITTNIEQAINLSKIDKYNLPDYYTESIVDFISLFDDFDE